MRRCRHVARSGSDLLQLLNKLLEETSQPKRKEMLATDESLEAMKMNDGYFFKLLDRMTEDVKLQRNSKRKRELQGKLVEIHMAVSKARPV